MAEIKGMVANVLELLPKAPATTANDVANATNSSNTNCNNYFTVIASNQNQNVDMPNNVELITEALTVSTLLSLPSPTVSMTRPHVGLMWAFLYCFITKLHTWSSSNLYKSGVL